MQRPKKKPKNRRPLVGQDASRRSTLSIRMFLKNFCIQVGAAAGKRVLVVLGVVQCAESTLSREKGRFILRCNV